MGASPNISGTLSSASDLLSLSVAGCAGAVFQLTGTWSGTVTFEGSADGSSYVALSTLKSTSTTPASTTTSNGVFFAPASGLSSVACKFSSFGSGVAFVTIRAAEGGMPSFAAGGGGGGGGTSSPFGDPFPSSGTAAGFEDASGNMAPVVLESDGSLPVTVVAGGTGGGAVTIADGADVAEGTIADVAVTGDNSGTVSAKLRGLNKILADVWDSVNHWLKVSIQNTTLAVTQSGSWTTTVTQGTASNLKAQVTGIGTAGTADTGVQTIQGIAGMTKVLVTPDANSAVNLAQVAGSSTATGNGTAAGSIRVSVASDSTGQIQLAAGSAAIGSANITTAIVLKRQAIAASSSGDNTVVTAVSSKKITVVSYALSFSGTVNGKFLDGSGGTNVGGLFYGVANSGAAESVSLPTFLWQGTTNTSLILNLSGSVAVGGAVTYYEA